MKKHPSNDGLLCEDTAILEDGTKLLGLQAWRITALSDGGDGEEIPDILPMWESCGPLCRLQLVVE